MRRAIMVVMYSFVAIVAIGLTTKLMIEFDAAHEDKVAAIYANYEIEQLNRQNVIDESEEALDILEELVPLASPKSEEEFEENMDSTNDIEAIQLDETVKVVWFGTAIPAFGNEKTQAYPIRVGQQLGIELVNESVGNSSLRAGSVTHVSDNDPMGYGGMNWDVLLKSLTLSSEEKDQIMNRWNYWRYRLQGTPPWQLSEEDKAFYRSTSWDIKLAKHLGDGNRADLYVFDHGHNEVIMHQWDNTGELAYIPEQRDDRTTYIGAMAFLVDKIREDQPDAKICVVGHYENNRKVSIAQAQELMAASLQLPIERTWESTEWTQARVEVQGYWEQGIWIESDDSNYMTVTQQWMPDDLLPSSDETGKAIDFLADIHRTFIEKQLKQ